MCANTLISTKVLPFLVRLCFKPCNAFIDDLVPLEVFLFLPDFLIPLDVP